jgi:hypothetical protein
MTARTGNGNEVLLPIFYVDCEVEVQVTMGFVYERISFLNTTGQGVSGMFICPTNRGQATVCSCDITFCGGVYSTSVVPLDAETKSSETLSKIQGEDSNSKNGYMPGCFSMPYANLPKMSEIVVEIRYVEDLRFNHLKGEYSLSVPMTFAAGNKSIYENKKFSEVVSYRVLLAPGTADGNWNCPSHTLNVTNVSPGPNNVGKVLTLEGNGESINQDFVISYSAWADEVSGSVICEEDQGTGYFMAFLQPPAFDRAQSLSRKMVFLIDVSYSMGGAVLLHAKKALVAALSDLQPQDRFAVCAYDHATKWYQNSLIQASGSEVNKAKNWVNSLETTGATDILRPTQEGTQMLQQASNMAHNDHHHGSGGGLGGRPPPPGMQGASAPMNAPVEMGGEPDNMIPFLVLITDGAVYPDQENKIVDFVRQSARGRDKPVRVSTFGIGPYCNRYFLSNLSDVGMGYSETCLDLDNIEERMVDFLSKTKSPVLANIALGASNQQLTTYPPQIADLTVGAPLVIYGSYSGRLPEMLSVSGINASGPTTFKISSSIAENAPVKIMVEKRRIECMLGTWSISKDDKTKREIMDRSVEIGVPCVLTKTAAYENHDKGKLAQHHTHKVPRGIEPGATGDSLPPPSAKEARNANQSRVRRKNHSGGAVAAVGGCVIVGVGIGAVMAFGNPSATMGNLACADAMGSFMTDGTHGMGALAGDSWSAIANSDFFSNLGGGASDAFSFVGDGVGNLGDAIPGAFNDVGGFCSNICGQCGPIGDVCGPIGNCFDGLLNPVVECGGNLCGALGNCDICGAIEPIGTCFGQCIGNVGQLCSSIDLGAICGAFGGCANAIGGCLGEVGPCLGEVAANIGPCIGGFCECLGGLASLIPN